MKQLRHINILALAAVMLLSIQVTRGAKTLAGTTITNTATVTYDVGTATDLTKSDSADTTVAEIIDVVVTVQDSPVTVQPNDQDQVMTFKVQNIGNGPEEFKLTPTTAALGPDQFDPTFDTLWLDADGDAKFDPSSDTEITGTWLTGVLDPEDFVIVFSVSDIPPDVAGVDLVNGDEGLSNLLAEAQTAGAVAAPGTVLPTLGNLGVDAVVGESGGDDDDTGKYVIETVEIIIIKSVTVISWPAAIPVPTPAPNPLPPIPGSTVRYTVEVRVGGEGTATNARVTDTVPAGMTYKAGSATYQNAGGLTDAYDYPGTDRFDYHEPTKTVRLILPDLVATQGGGGNTPNQFLTFDCTID